MSSSLFSYKKKSYKCVVHEQKDSKIVREEICENKEKDLPSYINDKNQSKRKKSSSTSLNKLRKQEISNNKRKAWDEINLVDSDEDTNSVSEILNIHSENKILLSNYKSYASRSNQLTIPDTKEINLSEVDAEIVRAKELLKQSKRTQYNLIYLDDKIEKEFKSNAEHKSNISSIVIPTVKPASERIIMKIISNYNDTQQSDDDLDTENKINIKTRLNGIHEWLWKIPTSDTFEKVMFLPFILIIILFIIYFSIV